ncbi:MAG TPA: endolytic transglycosylase MltG [Acidimicrobiales bacterium]|nr:endolytic transglycosylase MltG [Acidimicrobiales bacterium]
MSDRPPLPDDADPGRSDAPAGPRPDPRPVRPDPRPAPRAEDAAPGRHLPGPDDEWDEGWDDEDDAWADDDYVELRRESSRGRRAVLVVGSVVVVLLLAVGGVGLWVNRQIDPPGGPGEVVEVEVPQGATADDIGRLLAEADVITSDLVWRWYLRINGGGPFQAGRYELPRNSAMGDVVELLSAGPLPPEERSFTVPEGLTVSETVARLADPDKGLGLDAAVLQELLDSGQVRSAYQPPDQPSNEGILFPETYRVGEGYDELSVLQLMVAQLDRTMAELGVESAQERFNLTPYEVLIVASLIEEETKVDAERPQVARVIYNRLRQGIPLGIDATSRYEAELAGRSREQIDFDSDSPYNTRKVAGLPPTPIANPGRASIAAALEPADGDWLYYVLQDAEGNHFFTASYQEFLAAKQRCADAGLGCG